MKKWLTVFIWLSLVFLAYKLYHADYLIIPRIHSPVLLAISVIFLVAANFANTMNWLKLLKQINAPVSFADAYKSIGISIFGKYVPGFIWTIFGRVSYISIKYNISKVTLSALSLQSQVITLWVGLLLGITGLLLAGQFGHWGWVGTMCFLLFTFIIYTPYINNLIGTVLSRIFHRIFFIPHISFNKTIGVLPWFFINWILWCIGFHLFVCSLYEGPLFWYTGLSFALAATLGIIAIFAPGGVGVREGILVLFFTQLGIPVKTAIAISVASRLWFLVGEVVFFVTALLVREKQGKAKS